MSQRLMAVIVKIGGGPCGQELLSRALSPQNTFAEFSIGVQMGFLEISVEMLNLSGSVDYSSNWFLLGWLLYLVAVLFLVRHLKPPRKEDRLF